jgi:hypothetical protein
MGRTLLAPMVGFRQSAPMATTAKQLMAARDPPEHRSDAFHTLAAERRIDAVDPEHAVPRAQDHRDWALNRRGELRSICGG